MRRRNTAPRFDVERALAEHAEKQRREFTDPELEGVRSPVTELRVIAAVVADDDVRARCDDLEVEDFTDLRCREVLTAIRALQHRDEPVTLCSVADEIIDRDEARAEHVHLTVNAVWLGGLVVEQVPYYGEVELLGHDLSWLRMLAKRRQAL